MSLGPGGLRALMRLARRSIMRNKLRSLLIVLLLAIPVAGAVGVSTTLRTTTARPAEEVRSFYGNADILYSMSVAGDRPPGYEFDEGAIDALVDDLTSRPGFEVMTNRATYGWAEFSPYQSFSDTQIVTISDVDLTNPMSDGLFLLLDGNLAATADEVVASVAFAEARGVGIGDRVIVSDTEMTVSGLGVVPTNRNHVGVIVTPAGFDASTTTRQNVQTNVRVKLDDGVKLTWQAAYNIGSDTVGPDFGWSVQVADFDGRLRTGAINPDARPEQLSTLLAALMAIEIALIAAAAFAVGTRRRVGEFGQLLATGADGAHIRNLLLLEAGLLALIGVAVGMLAGVVGASAVIAQDWIPAERWAPTLQWTPIDVVGPAVVALGAALIAAWWPASEAASAPVTSALAGRLPVRKPNHRTPVLGLIVLALGTMALFALLGIDSYMQSGDSQTLFVTLVVMAVAGMFLGTLSVIGHVLHLVSRGSTRFAERVPLALRLITRNSARNRGRSAAAVAAFVAIAAIPVAFGAASEAYPIDGQSHAGRLVAIGDLGPTPFGPGLTQVISPPPVGIVPFTEVVPHTEALPEVSAPPPSTAVLANQEELTVGLIQAARQALPEAQELRLRVGDNPLRSYTFFEQDAFGGFGSSALPVVATPALLATLDLDDHYHDALEAGTAVALGNFLHTAAASDPDADRFLTVRRASSTTVSIPAVVAPIRGFEFASIVLISPEVEIENDLEFMDVPVFINPDNLTKGELTALEGNATDAWLSLPAVVGMEPVGMLRPFPFSGPTEAELRWLSIAAVTALAILISLIVASLAAVEADRDFGSMIATGASPSIRRWMLGAQTTYHMMLAAMLGIPLAILIFVVILASDDYARSRLVLPWTEMAIMGFAIPIAVGLLVTLLFRSGTPSPSRRLT